MKKMTLKKLFGGICCAAMAMFAVSCAQGVDDETWTSGVSGVQLESPAADAIAFSLATDANGNEKVKVQWPVSMGAGGYEITVLNVNDPENPEVVVDHETVDGCSYLFPLAEDTNYEVSVLTLGNEKYNNAGAAAATTVAYSSMIGGVTIPAGTEIGQFITDYMTQHLDEYKANLAADPNFEWAFDLERGAAYTLDVPAEFGLIPVRRRGTLGVRPVVTVGEKGGIAIAAGFKVKNVNFDCSAMTTDGIIRCSDTQYTELEASAFGYPGTAYYIEKPIVVEACNFKNLAKSLVHSGNNAWAANEIQVRNCIVQFNNPGKVERSSFIDFYGNPGYYQGQNSKWAGVVRKVTVVNNTIYNIASNSKSYFIRYSNVSKMNKYYPTNDGYVRMENNTIYGKNGKQFGNGVPKDSPFYMTAKNNNFYDCQRLDKLFQKYTAPNEMGTNTIWPAYTNNNEKNVGVLEDQGFVTPTELDLTDSQFGGQNFKPTGTISSTIGDPRWLN